MTMNRSAIPLLAAALLSLAACDAGDAPPAEETPGDVPELEELAAEPGEMMPINQSDIRGRASVSGDEDGLRVEVEGEGLEPGSQYTAHVHEGRCANGGPIRLPLGRMTASPEGTGSLRMRVQADRLPAENEYFVQIHAADDQPVACANIEHQD